MTASLVLSPWFATPGSSAAPAAPEVDPSVDVVDLTVNGLPGQQLGIGDTAPTLAWRMTSYQRQGNPCFDPQAAGTCALDRQTAYEVEAAATESDLERGRLLWDTGRVASQAQSVELGSTLGARDTVVWRVRVWDAVGTASSWSRPEVFTVGLLEDSDWVADWIEDPAYQYQTDGEPNPLPIFGTDFDTSGAITSARLYATGLGQYSASLNGEPVGDAVLEPGQTSYWKEVNYRTYDVKELLERRDNVLAFEVGSGVYQQADTTSMGRYNFQPEHKEVMGEPKIKAQLEITYANGRTQTVATDQSWLARSGPTVFSSWWGGEDYDGRILPTGWSGEDDALADPAWHPASVVELDGETIPRADTPLVADPRPPVTVAERVTAQSITEQAATPAQTSVAATAAAGDERVHLASVTGIFAGDSVRISGQDYTVSSVGISAKTPTTLTAAANAGDTSISVASLGLGCYRGAVCEGSAGFVVGQPLVVGSGAASETVEVTGVTRGGTPASSPGTVTFTPALTRAHDAGSATRGGGTGVVLDRGLTVGAVEGSTVVSDPLPAYVLDFGRNLVGLLGISGRAPRGTTVSMLGSEQPLPPTNLNTVTNAGIYRYTFAGSGRESWRTQFTYNGQRYLVVRGLRAAPPRSMITLDVTYASNEQTSTFETCDPMLNSIYGITKRALEGNMLSVLTDCPNREKGPYTGDNLHNIDNELTMFDMRAYQRQLVGNMRTSQRPTPISQARQPDKYEGMIANIAPEFHAVPDTIYNDRWFLDEPNWGGAIIRIPWELYRIYGDTETMAENYEAMVKWLDYVGKSKADNPRGEINGLGDWSAGQATVPAEAIIDIGYYEGARVLALIADKLGKSADAETYSALAEDLREEYNDDYLNIDETTGRVWYANDTQASNAVALDSRLVPEEHRAAVFESLVRSVAAYDYRLSHGSVGGGAVFRALHEGGRDDLLHRMVVNPSSPSYAFQVLRGQTTLAEGLNGRSSQNHHFLGQVGDWMVHDVVGIDQQPDSVAYRELLVRPATGEGIDAIPCVEGSYTTPAGEASNRVVREDGTVTMTVTIPANTTAEVWVPTGGRRAQTSSTRASFERVDGEYAVYSVGAGTFEFTSSDSQAPGNLEAPVVEGQPVVGRTLVARPGTWDAVDARFRYQWNRDGRPVGGAVRSTYVPTRADLGRRLTVTVTATAGSNPPGTATSAPVGPVRAAPAAPSTTVLRAPSRATAGRTVEVVVTVRTRGAAPRGRVEVYVDGRLVRRPALREGRAQVGVRLTAGVHRLRANYPGDGSTGRSSDVRVVRVVRR